VAEVKGRASDGHPWMDKLIPQIRHWRRIGFVAAGKIINLHV
jgi:hypothetical protein